MKFITTILCSICFVFLFSVNAQNKTTIDELIERSKVSTFKSISEVFSEEEIIMLNDYYSGIERDEPIVEAQIDNTAFGVEGQTQWFGNYSTTDPNEFNVISTSPALDFEGAGAMTDLGDTTYSLDSGNNLFVIDKNTGVYNFLGKVTPPVGETFTGLETDPTDNNKLYAMSTDGTTQSTLSTINPATLALTVVGSTPLALAISLAINATGDLYTMDIDTDNLYLINKITAAITLIGYIGFDANFGQGMSRDAFTGLILMAAFNNDGFDSELRSVDVNTGLTTLIGVIYSGVTSQFGWVGIPHEVLGVENETISNIVLFPNPVEDLINLRSNNPIESITIFSMLGQQLMTIDINNFNAELDVSSLNAGLYIIKIRSNEKTSNYNFIKK